MERNSITKKVGILGIIGNIFLFIIKIIIGLISKSQAMIADSINSAGDIFASIMTWLGNKISSVPNDDDHNFGHGKAEYIFSMLMGISMIIVVIKLLYDSVYSIINGNKIIFSWNLIIVCSITIIIKLSLFLYTKYAYNKTKNLLIKSNMLDHRNDILLTSLTLLACIFSKFGIYYIDGIVGIIISIWILITGIKIYYESYKVLMDQAIDKESQTLILSIIKSYKEIKKIGNLYSVPIGYKYIVVVTLYVNGSLKTKDSHKIADKIEDVVIKSVENIEKVIIHIEPYKK